MRERLRESFGGLETAKNELNSCSRCRNIFSHIFIFVVPFVNFRGRVPHFLTSSRSTRPRISILVVGMWGYDLQTRETSPATLVVLTQHSVPA